VLEPPPHIIATPSKNNPVYLPCHAIVNIDQKFIEDNEQHESDYADYEDEEEEPVDAKDHFVPNARNIDLANTAHSSLSLDKHSDQDGDDMDSDDDDELTRKRRRAVSGPSEPVVSYSWFRNGAEWLSTNKSGPSIPGFRLFNNGTLKIQSNNLTEGAYRCLAKEIRFDIGSILSRECVVNVSGSAQMQK
jgi:hypothetical protein